MLSKELLLSVMKPARYIGHEVGSVKKNLSRVPVKFCLCFPDTYEIGMSHLGLRVLYDLLNQRRDCAAERVFCPWLDMEEKLRTNSLPLRSLESGLPLKEFDVLGFSIPYELNYTNVLNILSLAHIPLKAAERDEAYPLVIAGGTCCLNPEPMVDFIDCFVVGEGEEVVGEIVGVLKQYKKRKIRNKQQLLERLSQLEGVYVPSLGENKKIKKRYIKNLDKIPLPKHWIVPYVEIVHDRIGIEIMRGCPHGCYFCQARVSFFPRRLVSERKILKIAHRLFRLTGYEEISLLSLSSSDHPQIVSLVKRLAAAFRNKGVSISLPSLRAKHHVGEISQILSTMRKTTLTFAPEAGSERLRRHIHKNIDFKELTSVVRQAYQAGYRALKLYFMIGLPTETDEDLKEIFKVCQELALMKKEISGPPAQLKVSISNFIPKPHTPFEREAMASGEELLRKQALLKDLFKKTRGYIHVTFHEVAPSLLEGVLARGDSRLGAVIQEAYLKGARFDAWENCFNPILWKEAFVTCGIDPEHYLKTQEGRGSLSWDFIDTNFSFSPSAVSCFLRRKKH